MTRIDANVPILKKLGGGGTHSYLSLTENNKVFRLPCLPWGGRHLGKIIVYHFENARLRISVGATQIQVITRHASTSILFLLQFYADYTRNTNFRFVRILISL